MSLHNGMQCSLGVVPFLDAMEQRHMSSLHPVVGVQGASEILRAPHPQKQELQIASCDSGVDRALQKQETDPTGEVTCRVL